MPCAELSAGRFRADAGQPGAGGNGRRRRESAPEPRARAPVRVPPVRDRNRYGRGNRGSRPRPSLLAPSRRTAAYSSKRTKMRLDEDAVKSVAYAHGTEQSNGRAGKQDHVPDG